MTLICISMIELILTTVPEFDDYKLSQKYCSNISYLLNETDFLKLNCDWLKKVIQII